MDCTDISPECPLKRTIYGYYPNLGANAFFSAIFGVLTVVNLVLGIRYKALTFPLAMALGCMAESIGHAGRILLNDNPWNIAGFNMQICCLTLAPAFFAAAIYLTLKHIVLCFGEEGSFLKPRYYTWLFIIFDVFSLIFQAVGGGIAATSDRKPKPLQLGSNLMMVGISFQVATLLAFAAMAALYYVRRSRSKESLSPSAESVKRSISFQLFIGGFVFAFLTIFVRCVYRIAEMAGGWANPIMRSELEYIVLDSL